MAIQLSTTVRTNQLTQLSTAIGSSGTMKIFSGSVPANCAASDPSGLLVTITLPASPFNAASGGQMTLNGTWSNTASASGTGASFRLYDGSGNCHLQGTVGQGSGDLSLDNTNIASGQTVTITTFTLTEGNA